MKGVWIENVSVTTTGDRQEVRVIGGGRYGGFRCLDYAEQAITRVWIPHAGSPTGLSRRRAEQVLIAARIDETGDTTPPQSAGGNLHRKSLRNPAEINRDPDTRET